MCLFRSSPNVTDQASWSPRCAGSKNIDGYFVLTIYSLHVGTLLTASTAPYNLVLRRITYHARLIIVLKAPPQRRKVGALRKGSTIQCSRTLWCRRLDRHS